MLPSTGLFKTIACPFFESGQCMRPFCHYKHARRDETTIRTTNPIFSALHQPTIQLLETPAVYKPTPKILLASTGQPDSPEPVKKRKKLEYIPTPKAGGRDPKHENKERRPTSSFRTSEYQPTNAVRRKSAEVQNAETDFGLDDCLDELDAIVDMLQSDDNTKTETVDLEPAEISLYVPSRIIGNKDDEIDKPERETPSKPIETFVAPEGVATNGDLETHKKQSHSHSSRSRSSSSHRESSSHHRHKDSSRKSSSSSSRREHDRSSKDKDRASKDKDRVSKDKERDRHKERHSSSSKSTSSRDASSKSKDGSSKSSTKSSSDQTRSHKSSSTTSKQTASGKNGQSKASRSSDARNRQLPTTSDLELAMPSPSSLFDSESDEDDVMAQCRLIFDEYKTKTAAPAPSTASPAASDPPKSATNEMPPLPVDGKYDDCARKKRVAYDGANNGRPAASGAPTTLAKNYSHMAMESVFKRQEIVRIQLQKMEEKKAAELVANEKRLAEIEAERVARAKQALGRSKAPVTTTTTTTTTTYQQPVSAQPRRIGAITPASNILAMQRAKEKIDLIRAAKQPTISRTVSKAVGRVAHATSVTAEDLKSSPPVLEPKSTKISFNIRMQYYTLMVKHCQTIYDDCNDAWQRAQTVELVVFNKCSTPVIYKKSATLAINQLRKEAIEAGNVSTEKTKTVSHDVILAGKQGQNTSWSVNKTLKSSGGPNTNPLDTLPGTKAYDLIYELRLTEEQLHENGYPRPGDRPGWAKIHQTRSNAQPNHEHDRYCRRCGKIFNISHYDEEAVDQCNYHAKRPGHCRGHVDHLHRCCQQPAGSPGCMYGDYHVTENVNANRLTGYVKTIAKDEAYRSSRADVFALDCEMCYTSNGLDLTRVTVVDFNRKTVYDALVKPDYKVVDYNTQFSGITEEMLRNETRTLRDVQAVLLSMFHSRTVLVGHSLDSDLKALKLLHDVVVDTSVLYPHKMGLPMKRALKTLCIENLKRIIQESDGGHDSAEDAEVCIQLLRHFLQNKITSSTA